MRLRAFVLSGFVAALLAPLPLSAAAKPTYADRLAEAQRLAEEKSWALAHDAYAAALALAPDPEMKRWCELELAATSWRAEAVPQDWLERQAWITRHDAGFDELLARVTDGHTRNDFWAAVTEEKAAFQEKSGRGDPWVLRLAVAEYWGGHSPTPEAARRFVEFLVRLTRLDSSVPDTFREHLERGARLATSADDRAVLQLALMPLVVRAGVMRFDQLSEIEQHAIAGELRARWSEVLQTADGTRWAALARARYFFWRLSWRNRAVSPDYPALLQELDQIRWDLRSSVEPDEAAAFLALDQLEAAWRRRFVSINMASMFRPGEPVAFSYGAANLRELRFTLRRQSPETWVREASALRRDDRFPDSGEDVGAWIVLLDELDEASRHEWRSGVFTIDRTLEPGIYTLTTEGVHEQSEPMDRHPFVITSARASVVTVDLGQDIVFAYDDATQAPLARQAIRGATGVNGEVRTWQAETDDEGRAMIPPLRFDAAAEMYQDQVHVLAINHQPVVVETRRQAKSPEVPVVIDLFFDREIYRPGEQVHWKAVVRERDEGRFAIPDAKLRLSASLDYDDDELVTPTDFPLNAFGTAHGEFMIPAATRPGDLHVAVAAVDAAGDEREADDTATLRIENFVPPVINTWLDYPSGPASFRPGQEFTVRARVEYFSGGPVVGAPVQCTFEYSQPNGRELEPYELASLEAWEKQLQENPRTGTTDASGCAEFRLLVPVYLPVPSNIGVNVVVTPDGGLADNAHGSIRITATGLMAREVDQPSPLAAPGETRDFVWNVIDSLGQPAAFAGEARLLEKHWLEVWLDPQGRVISDAIALAEARRAEDLDPDAPLPEPWRRLHAGYEETVLATASAQAGADGRVTASFVLPHAGIYAARLAVGEAWLAPYAYRDAQSEKMLYVADESTTTLDLPPGECQLIAPLRHRFEDPMRLLAVVPEGTPAAVLVVSGEEEVVASRLDFRQRVRVVAVPELPSAVGSWTASLSRPDEPAYYWGSHAEIAVDHSTDLDLVLVADAATSDARPGSPGTISVTVRDTAGRPAPAELAVAISDEAVNQLNGRAWLDGTIFARYQDSLSWRVVSSEARDEFTLAVQFDPRPGGQIPSTAEETIVLSPFEVTGGEAYEYYASATLAGTRLRTELHDVGAAISVVTADFLRDLEASTDDVLVYTSSTELGGAAGNFTGKAVVLRQHFASTALWLPEQTTDESGKAHINFRYPDNLTQWRVEVYAVGTDGNSFGRVHTFTQTSLPLQARLQAPRALVVGDTAEPTALLLNRSAVKQTATVNLHIDGAVSLADPATARVNGLVIPVQGEERTAWAVRAEAPGTATFTLVAAAGDDADAMRTTLPILEDGILQATSSSGRLAAKEKRRRLELALPTKLDRSRCDVTLQLSASHAAALLEALSYLIDYPYGCVEQTMNRFMPAVVAKEVFVDLNLFPDLDLDQEELEIEQRMLARVVGSRPPSAPRAGLANLNAVVDQSLARLQGAFIEDEGFGWWPGATSTDLWMTAYVAWGLAIADDAGVDVPFDLSYAVEKALIKMIQATPEADDQLSWALAAAARYSLNAARAEELEPSFERVFGQRANLSAAGRASLALASLKFGDAEQRAVLLRNLENGAQRVRANDRGDTVHWGATGNYWRAMDGAVESTALTLLALLELDPQHPLIEPAVNWLVLNRRSAHWASTRDTAFAILALTKYISQRGELDADAEIDVFANGRRVQRVAFTRASLLAGDTTIVIDPKLLRGGNNTIELRRVGGKSPVYAVVLANSWAPSAAVRPQGHLITIARGFVRQKQEPTLLGTLRITPEPLPVDGRGNAAIAGEQVTACVTLQVPNELEYVMVEVPKPAGCEPLNPLSGYDARLRRISDRAGVAASGTEGPNDSSGPAAEDRPIYREEHDEKSVFFIDALAAGSWEIVFSLRATTPGNYRALPAEASAMYVPEVRANSDAQRLRIERRTDQE